MCSIFKLLVRLFHFNLSSKTKLTLYYALIYPYITYCNSTWSPTYVSNLNRIFYLQKRVVRAIANSDYRAHSAPLFAKLGILDIFQVNSFQIAKFMFYYQNQLLPPMFLNLLLTSSQVHNYGTRTANHYRSHSCRTNLKQFTVLYQGPKIWNSLPISITSSSSFFTFKTKMLQLLSIKSWIDQAALTQRQVTSSYLYVDSVDLFGSQHCKSLWYYITSSE